MTDPDRRGRDDHPARPARPARASRASRSAPRRATASRRSSSPGPTQPDLAVLDVKMPRLDGIEAARTDPRRAADPDRDADRLRPGRARRRAPSRPASSATWSSRSASRTCCRRSTTARARHEELAALREEADSLAEALAARKAIERAKGLLMEREGLSERTRSGLRKASQVSGSPCGSRRRALIATLAPRISLSRRTGIDVPPLRPRHALDQRHCDDDVDALVAGAVQPKQAPRWRTGRTAGEEREAEASAAVSHASSTAVQRSCCGGADQAAPAGVAADAAAGLSAGCDSEAMLAAVPSGPRRRRANAPPLALVAIRSPWTLERTLGLSRSSECARRGARRGVDVRREQPLLEVGDWLASASSRFRLAPGSPPRRDALACAGRRLFLTGRRHASSSRVRAPSAQPPSNERSAIVLDRERAMGDGVEQRAVVRDEQHGAGEGLERGLERLAALEVEVVRRLVEHEEVRARRDHEREREPAALAAREHRDRLLVLGPAGEEEATEQRSAPDGRGSPVAPWAQSSTVPRSSSSISCCEKYAASTP